MMSPFISRFKTKISVNSDLRMLHLKKVRKNLKVRNNPGTSRPMREARAMANQ